MALRMVSRDQSLGFGCAVPSNRASLAKLTPAGLSGRCAGAIEREDVQRYQQRGPPLGRVFPGRDQDCVGIEGRDDQNLGLGCAASPQNRPSLAKTDDCWLAWQMPWGC